MERDPGRMTREDLLALETDPEDGWVPLNECYSTREAALAARDARGGGQ